MGHVISCPAFDLGDRTNDIKAPTRVVVGDDKDHGPPGHLTHLAYAKMLARDLPNARLAILECQGHYYYFSTPRALHDAMRSFFAAI